MLTAWFDWFYIKTPTYQLRTSVLVWEVISQVIPINFVSIAWLMNKKYTLSKQSEAHTSYFYNLETSGLLF